MFQVSEHKVRYYYLLIVMIAQRHVEGGITRKSSHKFNTV